MSQMLARAGLVLVLLLAPRLAAQDVAASPADPAPEPGAAPAFAASRNPSAHALGADRLALSGYDPVAYFDEGGGVPRPGRAELQHEHAGVVYRFASPEHRELFAADPARFEPAFGGWCAYALALGKQVAVDPRAFRIGQGRLLLFADRKYTLVDGPWVEDEPELLAQADVQWKRLSGEEPRPAAPGTWRDTRGFNLTDDSLALEGFDPVSYFPEGGGRPVEGLPSLAATHRGVKYLFASEEHRRLFAADPERFEPQHGGWCSYAMGESGDLVEVDPEAFRLTHGRLHLFYVGLWGDTREDWDEDTEALKSAADRHWAERLERAAER